MEPAFFIGLFNNVLGNNTVGNNTEWQWITSGNNVTFTNWAANQTANATSQCGLVLALPDVGADISQWKEASCNQTSYGTICETEKVSQLTPITVVTPSISRHMG